MQHRLMTDAEIVTALRRLTQPRPIPISELASRAGLSRQTVYEARKGVISHDTRRLLSEILTDVMTGEMEAT